MSKETCTVVEPESQTYRLPRTALPKRYEISLAPDLKNFTFSGHETIHLDVVAPTDEIVLNAAELTVEKATAIVNGKEIAGTTRLDESSERLHIKFPKQIEKGSCELKISFAGILNDKLHGFYRSTYKDEKGQEKVIATTQFEATDARRAFPCYDEPDFKSVFQVTLIVDEQLTAISNTAVVSEKSIANKKKEVVFADSIKMSTYLVAFIVGEFVGTEVVKAGKVPIRIWCVPGKINLAKFAQDIAVFSTNFFADYYGIAYPADKMDLIAIPDFASGAMENLGAITFRETALLVDEKTGSHAELERIADVVAHEIAHMWFGDLVTMKWWNGIWLNEAFATFAEMLAVDGWKPNWKRWDSFGVSRATASTVDGLKSTRPIEFPVISPDEASAMFDVLTYEKGASVLRMLEQYLGADTFRKGVSLYLNKHKYGNAETTDLWDGIEEASKEPVRQMMDSWIFQPGYPMLKVEENKDGITISQNRFFYLPDGQNKEQLFHVPVMLKAETEKGIVTKKFILSEKSTTINLGGKINWLVVNEGGHGFYRVSYSSALLEKLCKHLTDKLLPIERFNLVNDTWASCLSGQTPVSEYLKLVQLFSDENDKNVWAIIIASLAYLNKVIDDNNRTELQAFVRKLLNKIYGKLGWEAKKGENELTAQLRGMIISASGALGNDTDVQEKAKEYFAKYKKDKTQVDPNVAQALVGVLAFAGNDAMYEEFISQYKNAKTPQEEQRFLFALAGFQCEDLLKKTLDSSISGEVRTQNAPYLIQAVMNNPKARKLSWEFFQTNFDKFLKLFPANTIPRMSEGVTNLVDAKLEEEVVKFFAAHKVPHGGKTIDQHLEKLKVAVSFKQREGAKLLQSLKG